MKTPYRMKARKAEIEAFIKGSLLPGEVEPSLRVRHPKILSMYRHWIYPQWKVYLRGSHTRRSSIHWLFSKLSLGMQLNQTEILIGFVLVETDLEGILFSDLLKRRRNQDTSLSTPFVQNQRTLPFLIQCSRIIGGYRPSVIYSKSWSPVRLPPKKVIGVGYKDHGSLGSGPSWKDQILPAEEENPKAEDNFLMELKSLIEVYPISPA